MDEVMSEEFMNKEHQLRQWCLKLAIDCGFRPAYSNDHLKDTLAAADWFYGFVTKDAGKHSKEEKAPRVINVNINLDEG